MFKRIARAMLAVLLVLYFIPVKPSYSQDFLLPAPGTMVNLSPAFEPPLIKGMTIHKDNPFLFDFIVDSGQSQMSDVQLKAEGDKLIKYFFACMTIPDQDLWVNLSPYEKDRMIPKALSETALGRDLLVQDYLLKQLTASLIYPEQALGKTFWDKVYEKAQQLYGTTQVPVNTFNKVWIMADHATVYEHNQTAFVVDGSLKVMLEEDYRALKRNDSTSQTSASNVSSQIVRDVILPEIQREINTGKNFSGLRQIFNSMILADWYKKNLKEALLTQVYADRSITRGVNIDDVSVKDKIYEQYLLAYKKGVFNYIKDPDPADTNASSAPRKYFSGGFEKNLQLNVVRNNAMLADQASRNVGNQIRFVVDVKTGSVKTLDQQNLTEKKIKELESEFMYSKAFVGVEAFVNADEHLGIGGKSYLSIFFNTEIEAKIKEILNAVRLPIESYEIKSYDPDITSVKEVLLYIGILTPSQYNALKTALKNYADKAMSASFPTTDEKKSMSGLIEQYVDQNRLMPDTKVVLKRIASSIGNLDAPEDFIGLANLKGFAITRDTLIAHLSGRAMSLQTRSHPLASRTRKALHDYAFRSFNKSDDPSLGSAVINRFMGRITNFKTIGEVFLYLIHNDDLRKALLDKAMAARPRSVFKTDELASLAGSLKDYGTSYRVSQNEKGPLERVPDNVRQTMKLMSKRVLYETQSWEQVIQTADLNNYPGINIRQFSPHLTSSIMQLKEDGEPLNPETMTSFINILTRAYVLAKETKDLENAMKIHEFIGLFEKGEIKSIMGFFTYLITMSEEVRAYILESARSAAMVAEAKNPIFEIYINKKEADEIRAMLQRLGLNEQNGFSIRPYTRERLDARVVSVNTAALDSAQKEKLLTEVNGKPLARDVGGIDLSADELDMTISRDDGGVRVQFDPAMIDQIRTEGVTTVVPVIIQMTPITRNGILPLLGLEPVDSNGQLAVLQ
jgi:hypothetical protein